MHGGDTQRAQHIGSEQRDKTSLGTVHQSLAPNELSFTPGHRRMLLKKGKKTVYLRRRLLAGAVVVLVVVLALILAASAQSSEDRDRKLPIDPHTAGPDAVLAKVEGVQVSTPIHPEDLTGLGYHPEGENLIEMSPRGNNLSRNALLRLLLNGDTPEKIQYHIMDQADRQGPRTGALDVGAAAGAAVYAPVSGTVTAIRQDPVLQKNASVVEIKPASNPDVRISVSLVDNIDSGLGPSSPVTAGTTKLGSVASSARLLTPQLAYYTSDAGNHVTVSALKTS